MLKLRYTKQENGILYEVLSPLVNGDVDSVHVFDDLGHTYLRLMPGFWDGNRGLSWLSNEGTNDKWTDIKVMAKMVAKHNKRKNVVDTSPDTGVIY